MFELTSRRHIMNWDRHVQRTADPFDIRCRQAKLGVRDPKDDSFDNLPAEEIKKLFERAAQSDQDQLDSLSCQEAGNVFCELHPEFKDTEKNAKTMRAHFTALGIAYPTLDDHERGYIALKSVGLVDLDQKELNNQQQRATKATADGVRQNQFDESEAYSLPLEEVRRRAQEGW
jgi:hypothetical protein